MFHGWMFDPDGDQAAADSTRSSTSLDTGSSLNPRTARRLVTASYTSMLAYLPPAIAIPVMKHSGTNARVQSSFIADLGGGAGDSPQAAHLVHKFFHHRLSPPLAASARLVSRMRSAAVVCACGVLASVNTASESI